MFLRILLQKLGILSKTPSHWDMMQAIRDRIDAHAVNQSQQQPQNLSVGPMITLHRLNGTGISINCGQIQSIEDAGVNALLIFASGNRVIVQESKKNIEELIQEAQKK